MDDIEARRSDYAKTVGQPFEHFFCPVLFRDDDVRLCQGHIVNKAFPGADRREVIQREDVDNFFGSTFEADFVLLAERARHDAVDVLLDPTLRRTFRPHILVDGQLVDHYVPRDEVPSTHSHLAVERPGGATVPLALKLEPNATLSSLDGQWEIVIEKDVRLSGPGGCRSRCAFRASPSESSPEV